MINGLLRSLWLLALPWMTFAEPAESVKVQEDGLVALYYAPSGETEQPPVLVLGGSEGGLPTKLAKPIAEAGFPVLALAYFNAPGLPAELEKIPLEYVFQAVDWLGTQHPDQQGITLVGWSKGAELALLMASRDPRITRVVAIAPSSVVWAGILKDWQKVPDSSWTLAGMPLPHVPFKPSGPVSGLRDLYSQSLANRNDLGQADIPIENIQAEIVLLSGTQDEIWPSTEMAEIVCQQINAGSSQSDCRHLSYEGLGHLLNYRFLDQVDSMYQAFILALGE